MKIFFSVLSTMGGMSISPVISCSEGEFNIFNLQEYLKVLEREVRENKDNIFTTNSAENRWSAVIRWQDDRFITVHVSKVSYITTNQVIKDVARHFNCLEADLLGTDTRDTNIIKPKHLCMFIIRYLLKKSFTEIGKTFFMDHASVMYACKITIPSWAASNDPQMTEAFTYFSEKYGIELIKYLQLKNV
jgi:chromosomal replication initiation ATPase DnaA